MCGDSVEFVVELGADGGDDVTQLHAEQTVTFDAAQCTLKTIDVSSLSATLAFAAVTTK